MYTTIFEFETKEDASVLIGLINSTLLEWNAQNNKVFIQEDLEEDAFYNKDNYETILEKKEIYVSSWVEDNTESSSNNYYDEYGLKESDFY